MVTRGIVFALFGAVIWYMNRALMPGRAVAMLGVLGAIGVVTCWWRRRWFGAAGWASFAFATAC